MESQSLTPPTAKIIPHTFTHLGHALIDHYAWLQDKNDPEVIAYLQAENAFAAASLKHTEVLQEQLFQEMRGRIKEDDSSVPEQRGAYFYYWRMSTGQQYRIFCRKSGSLDAIEEVLLDENKLAEGKSYCRVGAFEPSPDHKLLAYGVDTTGAWIFDLYVKDMTSGEVVLGPIPGTAWSAAWAMDSRHLFYTLFDASHRAYQLLRCAVGAAENELIYHEPDDSFSLYIQRTRSDAYLLLTIASQSTSEVRCLPADQPLGEFQVIHPRQHWLEYYIDHHGERFWIRTNDGAENFKLMEVDVSHPSKEHWREVIPHRQDTLIEEIEPFRDHLVVFERRAGLPQIRISAPDGVSSVNYVAFPDAVYTCRAAGNPEFTAYHLRISYSSLVTPQSTVDINLKNMDWQVRKVQEIPSGYDPAGYECQRVYAVAPDGVQVPISLVHRKGLQPDGSHPLLLEAYGSYGYSFDPNFDQRRLSLIDRGFVYAIAHVRGGSELGRAWYENGRLMHKKNTFGDLIACAEHLVSQGYTNPQRLAILGASAGGLLVTAVTNLRPDLFKAVVAMVPFTNVVTAMLMPDLPLTVVEYEQWGNPGDAQAFEYMLSYSPYEGVEAKAYPHILAKAGLNDLQVPYWDPAKWVAKLRAHKTDNNRLLLVTNMGAGHGGSSGRFDHLREDAQIYAFLIDSLGVS